MEQKFITQPGKAQGNPHIVKVLLYHRVVDDERLSRAHWSCINIEQFRQQLELLDRWGFTTITLHDYRLFCQGELSLPAKPVILTFDDGYLDTYKYAFPVLQEFGMRSVVFVLGDRRIRTNYWDKDRGIPEAPLMEGEHIIEMHEAGFEIGSHSLSHVNLTQIPEDKAWEEISRSRILLEILLNDSVKSFSYPYGLLNGMTKRMVKHAGYSIGCSVGSGPATFGRDPLEIRRITISNAISSGGFAVRLLAPFQRYAWMRWKLRKLLTKVDRRQREINRILEEKKRRQGHNPTMPPIELKKEEAYEE